MSLALKGLQDIKWKVVDLPDIVFFQEGPGVRKSQYTQDGIKLLNVANLQKGKIDLSTSERYISKEEAYGRYEHFLVDEGDLIIASSGIQISYFEEKMGFITKDHLPLCMNTSTIRFKSLKEDVLNIRYFMYFLKTNFFKKQIQRLITGSAQLNFGPSHLKQIKVILPEIAIQDKIVKLLDTTQNMIDKRQQQIEALSALKQSVFFEMFGDDKKVTKVKVNEVINSITAGLSTGGETRERELGELGVLTTSAVTYGIFDSKAYKVPPEDKIAGKNLVFPTKSSILVSRMNTKELVGAACIVEDDYNELFIPDRIWKIEPNTKLINPYYLISVIQSNLFRVQIDRISTGTSGSMQNISQKNFKNLEIPYPDLELQDKYAKKVSAINKKTGMLNDSLENLQLLYDSLLNKAFNGELFKKDIKV